MATTRADRAQDLRDLLMLHLLENEGYSAAELAPRFGTSRAAIEGFRNRTSTFVRRMGCACEKPENRDGGMPERWWAGA